MDPFLLITANFTGASRHATLHGRDYLVVPMVMLTEGVHNGSNGPLFYPEKELQNSVGNWNHKPLVVYHPMQNGSPISACTPDVLEAHGVGMIMNARYMRGKRKKSNMNQREPGKLMAEAWFDTERLKKVDERVMMNIESDEATEVSTGLAADYVDEQGEWNGEEYEAIAVNYRADHLAILPDQVGACSLKDGCGLGVVSNCSCGGKSVVNALTANDMSYSNISSQLYEWVYSKYGDGAYVMDIYPKFFIFCTGGEHFKLGYTADDTEVTVSTDKPIKVLRVTEYRTEDGAYVGNTSKTTKEIEMNKTEFIDNLIKNTSWTEEDRPSLEGLEEAQLERLGAVTTTNTEGEGNDSPKPKKPAAKPATVANTVKQTAAAAGVPAAEGDELEDYLAKAPAAIRNTLRNAMAAETEQRDTLIESITNAVDTYTAEDLAEMTTPALKKLAATVANLAKKGEQTQEGNDVQRAFGQRSRNYGGAAGGQQRDTQTDNASREEGLVMPALFGDN